MRSRSRHGGLYRAFGASGGRGYLDPDALDRALSLLYLYWKHLGYKLPARRQAMEFRPVVFSAQEVYLADIWLAQRMDDWKRSGRIGRFGNLKPNPLEPVSFVMFRRCWPHLRTGYARAIYDDFYPRPADATGSMPPRPSVATAQSAPLPDGPGTTL